MCEKAKQPAGQAACRTGKARPGQGRQN